MLSPAATSSKRSFAEILGSSTLLTIVASYHSSKTSEEHKSLIDSMQTDKKQELSRLVSGNIQSLGRDLKSFSAKLQEPCLKLLTCYSDTIMTFSEDEPIDDSSLTAEEEELLSICSSFQVFSICASHEKYDPSLTDDERFLLEYADTLSLDKKQKKSVFELSDGKPAAAEGRVLSTYTGNRGILFQASEDSGAKPQTGYEKHDTPGGQGKSKLF